MTEPLISQASAAAAYATASHVTVFVSVALSFLGLGWALALMLRPKTCASCIWSMAIFSLAWLIESTTHLLGLGGHAGTETLKYGVWLAVGLFGIGLLLGGIGVLAYVRNEHRYERGLVVGVFSTLLNLWVVGGIVSALRDDRAAELGRGLVIPMLESGGPVDAEAIAENRAKLPGREREEKALRLTAMLGQVVSDLTTALARASGPSWELEVGQEDEGSGSPSRVLRRLHSRAQHRLSLSSEPGWMSLALADAPASRDPAAELAAQADRVFDEQLLSLMPQRRLRAVRTHMAGFEVIRTSTLASIKGVAGAMVFDRWVAVAGPQALEVWACTPVESPTFFDATGDMVVGVLRKLQRDGVAGPRLAAAVQTQRDTALGLERTERFDEALTAWNQAAVDTPQDAEVVLGVIRCSWKLGKAKEALAWLDSMGAPAPGSVAATVGRLRLQTATGLDDARTALINHFEVGLADDDALASLVLSFAARDDRPGALAALAAYGDRHAATLVAWWHGYLTRPPTTPTAAVPPTTIPAPDTPSAETAESPPPRAEGTRPHRPRGRRAR